MRPDKFFDAMGEIDEKYIIVKLRIPRLHMSKRIVLSSVISFAAFYLLSSALFALLLFDIPSYSLLEGQLRQLAVLIVNALAGVCSAFLLRRVIRRGDYGSFVAFSVALFLAVLAIGYALFYTAFAILHGESQLLTVIADIFPQMLVTAFAAPAPVAQFTTLFIINKFLKPQ